MGRVRQYATGGERYYVIDVTGYVIDPSASYSRWYRAFLCAKELNAEDRAAA